MKGDRGRDEAKVSRVTEGVSLKLSTSVYSVSVKRTEEKREVMERWRI